MRICTEIRRAKAERRHELHEFARIGRGWGEMLTG